jgi:hypothetical protein
MPLTISVDYNMAFTAICTQFERAYVNACTNDFKVTLNKSVEVLMLMTFIQEVHSFDLSR